MPSPDFDTIPAGTPVTYTPGHAKRKLLVIFVGILVFAYGLSELWVPLKLLLTAPRAVGEVIRVIKTKEGLPDQSFTDPLKLKASLETRDTSYIFWNEFHFATPDGKDHVFRLLIGSQLQPLFPLLDDDGLPTTVQVCYDPQKPDVVCVPSVLSTWFAPGLITFVGFAAIIIGLILFATANRPITVN